MRVDLNVPYAEKDEAKRLGAWWDSKRKTWYVVNREDLTPFARWFREAHAKTHGKPAKTQRQPVNEKPGILVIGSGNWLPVCQCENPPWDHCEHTSGHDDRECIDPEAWQHVAEIARFG